MADDILTELTEMELSRVDGVTSPANGSPFLILKSAGDGKRQMTTVEAAHVAMQAQEARIAAAIAKANTSGNDDRVNCPTCKGTGKIMGGKRKCPEEACTNGKMSPAQKKALAGSGKTGVSKDGVGIYIPVDTPAPGSPEWEAQDAANLDQAAQLLIQAAKLLDVAGTREQIEVAAGDTGDQSDVWDLQDAGSALDYATQIVARLAYMEQAEGGVSKAGKRLSGISESKIRAALQALQDLLDGGTTNKDDGGTAVSKDKETLEMELTQEEFDAKVAKAAEDAVTAYTAKLEELAKAEADAAAAVAAAAAPETPSPEDIEAARVAKAAEKAAKKAAKVAKAAENEDTPVTLESITEVLKAAVAPLEERIAKFEKRPRTGGPVLDGIAKSGAVYAPDERDVSEQTDPEIAALQKAVDEARNPAYAANAQNQLAIASLRKFHENGGDSDPAYRVYATGSTD